MYNKKIKLKKLYQILIYSNKLIRIIIIKKLAILVIKKINIFEYAIILIKSNIKLNLQ